MRYRVQPNRKIRARTAFTLIELLLVLIILGLLAAVVVPKLTGTSQRASEKTCQSSVANLAGAINRFEQDTGRFPTNDEGIRALYQKPTAAVREWNGPYIEQSDLNDPWTHQFLYQNPGTHNTAGFDLYSAGPDGQPGTADDIGNWK